MKTSSRKRLLVSSVAMLLVAMLALGTATYAWFTTDTTATADGLGVSTSKTSSLKISDAEGEYGSGFTYNGVEGLMKPASSVDGTNWFSTVAASETSYAAKSDASIESVSGNKLYVYKEQLNIQNAGKEMAVNNVTVKVTNFNSHKYLRVALVPVTAKGASITTQTDKYTSYALAFQDNVYAFDKTAYQPITAVGALPTTGDTSITPKAIGSSSAFSIKVADTLAAGDELHFNLYVWFEGQDTDCMSTNAGTGASNLKLVVEGTPASEITG